MSPAKSPNISGFFATQTKQRRPKPLGLNTTVKFQMSKNKEFKSVKNIVIAEAMILNLPTDEVEGTDEPVEPDREPTAEEAESPDPPPPMAALPTCSAC